MSRRLEYPVVIIGASFAGLAAASHLHTGEYLLIDRLPIGMGQTSACGTPRQTIQAYHGEPAVQQIHDQGFIHTPYRTISFPLDPPFCTFNYREFCMLLSARLTGPFLKTRVYSVDPLQRKVYTGRGEYGADLILDCSGPLGVSLPGYAKRRVRHVGLETEIDAQREGLHFYFLRSLIKHEGYWVFPAGAKCRIGVGSYLRKPGLPLALDNFLESLGFPDKDGFHGGFMGSILQRPVLGGSVIRIGDAAGQCLPLSCEGIRQALYFGRYAGGLLDRYLCGRLGRKELLRGYQSFVQSHAAVYRRLRLLEYALRVLPPYWLGEILAQLERKGVIRDFLSYYSAAFDFDAVAAPLRSCR
ncbi:MAG: hypothetical protein ACM3WV_07170 [Bacillota bacterium]